MKLVILDLFGAFDNVKPPESYTLYVRKNDVDSWLQNHQLIVDSLNSKLKLDFLLFDDLNVDFLIKESIRKTYKTTVLFILTNDDYTEYLSFLRVEIEDECAYISLVNTNYKYRNGGNAKLCMFLSINFLKHLSFLKLLNLHVSINNIYAINCYFSSGFKIKSMKDFQKHGLEYFMSRTLF